MCHYWLQIEPFKHNFALDTNTTGNDLVYVPFKYGTVPLNSELHCQRFLCICLHVFILGSNYRRIMLHSFLNRKKRRKHRQAGRAGSLFQHTNDVNKQNSVFRCNYSIYSWYSATNAGLILHRYIFAIHTVYKRVNKLMSLPLLKMLQPFNSMFLHLFVQPPTWSETLLERFFRCSIKKL